MKLRRSVPLFRLRNVPVVRAAAVAGAAALTLSGCGLGSGVPDTPAAAAPPAVASSSAASGGAAGARSALGSVKDEGDLPDPCTLLNRQEVADLTHRTVTRIDVDDADPGESTRYCQWQQDGGQLALFVSRTSYSEFRAQIVDAKPVKGVGDEAFLQAGHLYVLYGTVEIDVYSYGGSDNQNRKDAIKVAKAVLPRI